MLIRNLWLRIALFDSFILKNTSEFESQIRTQISMRGRIMSQKNNKTGKNVHFMYRLVMNDRIAQTVLLAPALIMFTLFIVYPCGMTLWYSFTDWTGIGLNYNFVWFNNYSMMFRSPEIFKTIPITLYYAALNSVTLVVVGFFIALALNRKSRITNLMRVCFFLPTLLSPLVVGFVFKEFFSPVLSSQWMGSFNRILKMLGLTTWQRNWLSNKYTAMPLIVFVGIWYNIGQTSLIYLANMRSISQSLYEAAMIDGAGYWRQTYNITFRMTAPALRINVILLLISSMQSSGFISVLTSGGPGTATKVINLAIVEYTISAYRVGLGSAMAMVVSATVFILVVTAQKLISKLEHREV